ncbi:MAG: hypothetical protein UX38_C0004G0036 [Microgenomates group bacterium GW2011_GWC1_46_16]|nr:MAG: hypothetical protein UX38_C0004G0036 [Microgenomates group bacterium GW2011_GWC1_46_16]
MENGSLFAVNGYFLRANIAAHNDFDSLLFQTTFLDTLFENEFFGFGLLLGVVANFGGVITLFGQIKTFEDLGEKGGVGEIFQVVLFHWNLRIFEDQFEVVFDVFTIDVENSFGHILIIAIKKPRRAGA